MLRLASALLESPASLSFICSIVSSHREILQEEYECLKLLATRIRQIDKPKAEIWQIATSVLQKMTQVTQFRWSTPKGPNKFCIDGQTWRNGHEKVCVHPNTSGFKSTICINKYIFQAVAKAAKPINKAPWNVCLKLRWQFLSASTFCHEVIHAIQQAVRVSLIMVEPFWEDDRIAELGQAWE